jgi:hypothetical protein
MKAGLDPRIKMAIDFVRTLIDPQHMSSSTMARIGSLLDLILLIEERNDFPRYNVRVG